jgi:acyl-CoA synthetase (AMP-forming)/AMP-acid ligase II
MGSPVLDVLRAAARRHPDRRAVVDTTGAGYTYAGLVAAVEDGARWLRELGPRPPLLLVPGNGPDDVVAVFAAVAGGCVPLIADRTWTAEECTRVAAATGASAVLAGVGATFRPEAPAPTPWPGLRWAALAPTPPNPRLAGIGFGRFTSGSTGMPRCLGFTETAAVNAGASWRQASGLTGGDVVLCLATLNNGLAFNTSLLAVFGAGATLVLHTGRPIPSSIARAVRAVAPSVLVAFPFAFDALVAAGRDLGGGLRLAVSSAAPLSAATAQAWQRLAGVRICDYYGLAEAGPVTFNDGTVPGSVGVPLPGVQLAIEDAAASDSSGSDGSESDGTGSNGTGSDGSQSDSAGSNGTGSNGAGSDGSGSSCGRVLVRTASMAARFLDDREPLLDAELTPQGFLRTKDVGRLGGAAHDAGRLYLSGRLGQVVNVAGRKIDPTEVAEAIRGLPGVRDVVVRGEPGGDGGELLAAYVESSEVDRDLVVAHCRRTLSVYKLPQRIAVLPRFPRTSTGKVNAAVLAETGR